MKVPLPHKKSPVQRFLDKVTDALDAPSQIKAGLPSVGTDSARKAGVIAGAVAGMTAGSAGISALRRRNEGAREDS